MGSLFQLMVTYELIKPHVNEFLWDIILPLMPFGLADSEKWARDPEGYANLRLAVFEPDPRASALNAICTLLKVKYSYYFTAM